MLPRLILVLLFPLGLAAPTFARVSPEDELVRPALEAEARLDSARALELFLAAEQQRRGDPFLLQKIARQYSDLVVDQRDVGEKRRLAGLALDYAERAVAADPRDPISLLSVAISRGKLAVYSDTRTKVRYSRDVKDYAERALAIAPDYAWAHHVLGRWHYEVAALGMTARFFVKLFYGGLPSASVTEAVTHLERAVALEPDELTHHIELGFAYAAAGRRTEAKAAWERGLALTSRGKHDEPAKRRARAALDQNWS